jgi:SPX domain protein involved in polyphosphate accumulation
MKFGKLFATRTLPEWLVHSLDYKQLKHLLKQQLVTTKEFLRALYTRLDRMERFWLVKRQWTVDIVSRLTSNTNIILYTF